MREFLDYVLRTYETHAIDELAPSKLADFLRIRYGGTSDAKLSLGPFGDIATPSSTSWATSSADKGKRAITLSRLPENGQWPCIAAPECIAKKLKLVSCRAHPYDETNSVIQVPAINHDGRKSDR